MSNVRHQFVEEFVPLAATRFPTCTVISNHFSSVDIIDAHLKVYVGFDFRDRFFSLWVSVRTGTSVPFPQDYDLNRFVSKPILESWRIPQLLKAGLQKNTFEHGNILAAVEAVFLHRSAITGAYALFIESGPHRI